MTGTSRTSTGSFRSRDDLDVAFTTSGDVGPHVLFVHATGFCKELAEPVIAETRDLGVDFAATAIDQRGHGDSDAPEPPFDWWDIGGDIVELLDGRAPVIGVGHSSGGAVLAMAEILAPGTFAELILVEPIILPPPYVRYPDNPMSVGARKRRPGFVSRQAAFDNFMAKKPFAEWEERSMWAYVNGGLRRAVDGFALKCVPDVEAEFFAAATTHGAWDRLAEIESPTRIIAGERSTTHREPFLGELTARFGAASSMVIPETSHFVWMEKPAAVAAEVAAAVRRVSDVG